MRRGGPFIAFVWDPDKLLSEENAALKARIRSLELQIELLTTIRHRAGEMLQEATTRARDGLLEAIQAFEGYFGESSADEPPGPSGSAP